MLMVHSAATPLRLSVIWYNIHPHDANQILRSTNMYRYSALDIVYSFRSRFTNNDLTIPRGDSWLPLSCSQAKLVQDMHANFIKTYGKPFFSTEETIRLLNT